jgi:hypothetical protein
MQVDIATARFAELARAYCQWAEGPPGTPLEEMLAARLHVARLYGQALELSDSLYWNGDAPEVTHEVWQAMFKRFGALAVNYYQECCEPFEFDDEPDLCTGDLADDLADIWRDIRSGLDVYDAGHVDGAVHEWREHFCIHWGRHAARALNITEYWISRNVPYTPPGC